MRALLLALVLSPPVVAPPAERFDYTDPFVRGAHRGLDYAAPDGAVVRAPCNGTVAHAGPVAGEGVVSLRCGAHRVSLVGVRALVRQGAQVLRGQRVGRALGEVHLGVRREGARFAYLDPERFLGPERSAPPAGPGAPLAPRRAPPTAPRAPRAPVEPRPFAPPSMPAVARPKAERAPEPLAPRPLPRTRPATTLAPWPAWLGLALLLAATIRTVRRPPIASKRPWPSTSRRRSTT